MDASNKFIEFYEIMKTFIPFEIKIIILAGILFLLWEFLRKGKNDYKN